MSFSKQDISMPTKPGKYQIPKRAVPSNGGYEYYMTEELEKKFRELYPKYDNRKVMDLFGISYSTMQRFKRRLGLKKDMTKIYKIRQKKIRKACEKNGYYDSIRGKPIPHRDKMKEAFRKKYGDNFSTINRMKQISPAKYRRYIKLKSEMRKNLYENERKKQDLHLSRNTKLHIPTVNFTRIEVTLRSYAKQLGYILGDVRERFGERYTIYYDENTERRPKFETNLIKRHFKVEPLTE